MPPLKQSDWDAIKEGYEAGHSLRALAAQYGVKAPTIHERAKRDKWIKPYSPAAVETEIKKKQGVRGKGAYGGTTKTPLIETALAKRGRGRPPVWPRDLEGRMVIADYVCERLAEGVGLKKILDQEGMPTWSVVDAWARDHVEIAEKISRARDCAADVCFAKAHNALDRLEQKEIDPNTGRVLVEGYLKLASKLKPRVYGDRLDVTNTNTNISLGYVINLTPPDPNAPPNAPNIIDVTPEPAELAEPAKLANMAFSGDEAVCSDINELE